MKTRPKGFISDEHISHESEIFDYIGELHDYLWRFVRVAKPGASGSLSDFVDTVIDGFEAAQQMRAPDPPSALICSAFCAYRYTGIHNPACQAAGR